MLLAVLFIIKCRIVGINIFRKAFLNMDECFTETLEVDNFALAQETNRITNFPDRLLSAGYYRRWSVLFVQQRDLPSDQ